MTGMANDVTMWDGQISAPVDDFRILRHDLRGHKGTQTTADDPSFPLLMGNLPLLWDARTSKNRASLDLAWVAPAAAERGPNDASSGKSAVAASKEAIG